MERDLLGYGGKPPQADWPGGARVAVSFVVNVEEGAELSLADGDPRNEAVPETQKETIGVPDFCGQSQFDYGTRAGWWRVMDTLAAAAMPATVSICGRAAQRSPWLVQDALRRGHEVSAHGWRWEGHAHLAEEEERETIRRTAQAILAAGGVAPIGWHTRSSRSVNTRRLLQEHGTFLYDSDDYGDDLPMLDARGDYVVLPYSFDTNDMNFHQNGQRFVHADDFSRYVLDAFEQLWREGAETPKMMAVGLHIRIIGRPGRIAGLEAVLKAMRAREHVWFARRGEIARHWLDRFGRKAGQRSSPA